MGLPLIFPVNRLIYPGGAPGFDPSHFAAARICFSAVATPAGPIALTPGAPHGPPSVTGSPTLGIDGHMGPYVQGTGSGGTTSYYSFANTSPMPLAYSPNITIAAIASLSVVNSGTNTIFNTEGDSPATAGSAMIVGAASLLTLKNTNANVAGSSGALSANVPYLFILSQLGGGGGSGVVNWLVMRLDNGKITSGTNTGLSNTPGNPTSSHFFTFGGAASAQDTGHARNVAAVMASSVFLTLPQMLLWAQRPWDFWYPPTVENLIFTALAAPSAAAPAYTFTQPLIGSQQPPPLDHPQSTLLIGVSGPNVKTPDIEDSVLVLQEAPFHPASRFGAGVQGPNVGALPQVGTLVLRQFYPLDHPLPRFIAGVQGPNVEPAVTSAIVIRREEIDYPRHPVSFFYPGRQGPNVASPEQIGRLVVGQFVPLDHPASLFYPGRQGPNVRPPVSDTILQLLELPWHPASFVRGQPPITLIFVPPVRGTIVQALEMPLAHPLGMFFPGPPGPNVTPSVNNTDYILRARRRKRR